ncbi:MAG: IS1595 family transposase [Conexibacter sp.]
MSKVDRNNPRRSSASESSYSLMEFMRDFPDDATCLEWLWKQRFARDDGRTFCPKCDQDRKFHRVKARPSYSCDTCGHHIHPTAGTIFHRSATSLHLWFYAMYLMTSTRCGISAKQVERELGVTYKTAWRMCNLIRNELMRQDDRAPLTGAVEADETAYGGRPKASATRGMTMSEVQRYSKARKVGIVAMVERDGKARAFVQPRAGALDAVSLHVSPEATVYTDEWAGYRKLRESHPAHFTICHGDRIYASGHIHTNTVEGFFGNLKRGIAGNYHAVSRKWLQGYVNEYVWRYNHRRDGRAMFETLLLRAAASR